MVENKEKDNFEPKIVVFACNWCSYMAADLAGTSRMFQPPNIRIIRVMCSGRVDPQFVLEAFYRGPLDNIVDYGGKAISFIASILNYPPLQEKELDEVLSKFPDWVGTVYRYYLPAAKLGGRLRRDKK